MRVLIVDPDRDVRETLVDLLDGRGDEVCGVGSASDALSRLDERAFDAVLCHLPLLRAVLRRARSLSPAPRVVAMSAAGGLATSDEADANLAKPFSRAQLLEALAPLLQRD